MANLLFDDKPHYSIDTSALIDWWEIYPLDIFPGIRLSLERLITERRLQASRQVRMEVEGSKKDPAELAHWCKNHPELFRQDDRYVQEVVKELMAEHQVPKRKKGIGKADPFVIAHAIEGGEHWLVVSSENPRHGNADKNPNIPFVCKQRKVEHINFLGLLRNEGLNFPD